MKRAVLPPALATEIKALKKRLGLTYPDLHARSGGTFSAKHMENLVWYGDLLQHGPTLARPSDVQALERLRDILKREAAGQPARPQPAPPQPALRDLAEILRELRNAVAAACHVRVEHVTIGVTF